MEPLPALAAAEALAAAGVACACAAAPPAEPAPTLDAPPTRRQRRQREKQRPAAAAADGVASAVEPAAFYGPGYKWDAKLTTPLDDAASQMFSLCLRWRGAGETLNAFKLNKLESIAARQSDAAELGEGALSRQRFTAALLRAVLERWAAADERGPPQAKVARRAKVLRLADTLFTAYNWAPGAPQLPTAAERWRHARVGEYFTWLEGQMRAAEERLLGVSPLKHVMLQYDRSLLLPAGLWLEFGVAEGATMGLIAKHIPSHVADGVLIGTKGEESNGRVFGFDSFIGLPEDWRPGFDTGHFERQGGALPSFAPEAEPHIRLVKGWFEETLPIFLEQHVGHVALLHLDSDIYSAAIYVLRSLIR